MGKIADLRAWFKKKNMQMKYERIVKQIQQTNSCPNCGQTKPDIVKIYQATGVKYEATGEGIWIAAMNCTRYGCNTSWTAPVTVNNIR